MTTVTRSRTPNWYASIEPTNKIPTKHESPLEEIESSTPGTSAHLQDRSNLSNLSINSVLSRRHARFVAFGVSNSYLATPIDRTDYVRIRLENIPQEFIDEYNLTLYAHNGWIYFKIIKGCYRPPQSRKLANDLLRTRLNNNGYYEKTTTPGLWRHKWRPIMVVLVVDKACAE